ncbi:hypothetical protein BY996DRAFT_6523084 [Phakopsora pachyrhizi]|nr:hypothetical protein BY996DRAFT_6523084 [Phakopsora pachyrhizi]
MDRTRYRRVEGGKITWSDQELTQFCVWVLFDLLVGENIFDESNARTEYEEEIEWFWQGRSRVSWVQMIRIMPSWTISSQATERYWEFKQ